MTSVVRVNLFHDVESSLTSLQIIRIISIAAPISPQFVSGRWPKKIEREESKVAICHVVILGAKQEPRLDLCSRVTEHHHCRTYAFVAQKRNHTIKITVCTLYILYPVPCLMNTLPNKYKLLRINLTMSPLYLAKLKITQNSRPLTAVRFVEPTVPEFTAGKSFNVQFFFCSSENFFSSLLT